MTTLDIVICTLNEGIRNVYEQLLPPSSGITYIVSMQYDDERFLSFIPEKLKARVDVKLLTLQGHGLCKNRNYALRATSSDYVMITDDDVKFDMEGIKRIANAFDRFPKMDIGLFRLTDYEGKFFKRYPVLPTTFQTAFDELGYYPCSCEMILRRERVVGKIFFDERFGLGSDYLMCGEEDVFLADAIRKGMGVVCIPIVIGQTDSKTTGDNFLNQPSVQRSKGATFFYCFGPLNAFYRIVKETFHYLVRGHLNAGSLFLHMCQGVQYIVRHERKDA